MGKLEHRVVRMLGRNDGADAGMRGRGDREMVWVQTTLKRVDEPC